MDVVISDLSGGRNGVDSPVSAAFPPTQCVTAVNVDFRNGGLGWRRGGSYDVFAGTTGEAPVASASIASLIRHQPAGNETQGETWAFDSSNPSVVQRILPGAPTVWVNVTGFGVAGTPLVSGVSFNGKLFLFYSSGTSRLHVIDSGATAIRVVGIAAPAAPAVANQGVGAYAATPRWYRVRFIDSVTTRQSEPSTATAFTPSGAGLSARVTRPALLGEGEDSWMIEVSADNVNFYNAFGAALAIGTTFFDDVTAPSAYSVNQLSAALGTYTLIPSVEFGVTDGNRLIVAGDFVSGNSSRVYWTPELGTLNQGDDERIFQTATVKPYLDLNTKNGGKLTGMGQINGVIYVFKFHQIWRLTPTGDAIKPYQARRLSGTIGSLNHKSIALGEDAYGNPCLYFMSHDGPYRVGTAGVEYVGRDLEDVTRDINGDSQVNPDPKLSHSIFHDDLSQWWLWWSTPSGTYPNTLFVLDVKKATIRDEYGVRGGWSNMNGFVAEAACSCMGPSTLAASAILKPWTGSRASVGVTPYILINDRNDLATDRATTQSNGTAYRAYVVTRSVGATSRLGHFLRGLEAFAVVKARTSGAMNVVLRLNRDFEAEYDIKTAVIGAGNAGIRKVLTFSSAIADAYSLQLQIGDTSGADAPSNENWQIDAVHINVLEDGDGSP